MVKLRSILIALVVAACTADAQAGPDFYGVKMKSEDFAQDLMVRENNVIPDFSNDRPGIDRRIYAYGYASSFFGRGRGVSIKVHNHSEETIPTQRLFRECIVVTKDGRRYDRGETEMQWRVDELKPGQSGTFNMIFKGVDLRLEDIRMLILSFDLGRINIFLFPTRGFGEPTEPPARVEAVGYDASDPVKLPEVSNPPSVPTGPSMAAEAPAPKAQAASAPPSAAGNKPASPQGPHCVTPVTMVQSMFSGLGNAVGSIGRFRLPGGRAKETPDAPPAPKKDFEAAPDHFTPEARARVEEGEKQVKEQAFVDRPWSMSDPNKADVRKMGDYPLPQGKPPRVMAQVVQVDPPHGFIVLNAGTVDGVKEDSVVSVLRNGRRIGKAMVRKVRDKVSAASILPEWQTKTAIKAGDQVELS